MSEDLKYHVLAKDAKYSAVPVTENERNRVKGLGAGAGCATWGALWLAFYVGIALLWGFLGITFKDSYLIFFGAVAGASIAVPLISSWLKKKHVRMLISTRAYESKTAYESEARRATAEATSLTLSLLSTLKSSNECVGELRQHINHASLFLQKALNEYHSNAFSPFWDAVENTAQHLATFNTKTNILSRMPTSITKS